jgi:predicted dehydrogenase
MILRVAIVGCGKAAENHIAEIKKRHQTDVVAVCDSDPLMAEQFSLRHRVGARYCDFSQMLREQQPEVVHIATPPQSHCLLALQSIESGCHVFVEKPLAESRDRAAEMIRSAEKAGRKLTIGWTYYFDPVVRMMRELIAQGQIGEPVHLNVFHAYDLQGNFGRALLEDPTHWIHQLKGGLLHNNLDHLFSLIVEFVGYENTTLSLNAWQAANSPYAGLLDELRLSMTNARLSADIGFSSRARPLGHFLTLMGTKSTIHLNIANQTLIQDRVSNLPGPFGRLAYGLDQTRQAVASVVRNCARFVRSDFPALPGLGHLISAFYDSIEYDQDVPISYEYILRVSSWLSEVVNRVEQTMTVCS